MSPERSRMAVIRTGIGRIPATFNGPESTTQTFSATGLRVSRGG